MINVENLVKVREARLQQLGLAADAKYADPVKITDEIDWCVELYRRHPRWHVVDISNKAIEEVSASILNLYHKQKSAPEGPGFKLSPRRGPAVWPTRE